MNPAQVLRQAEVLKGAVQGLQIKDPQEASSCRYELQTLLKSVLLGDLEYALDKKVEQDLWNYVFKNHITVLQNRTKDRTNPGRVEAQTALNYFLDQTSGFYLGLVQEMCVTFSVDLPMCKQAKNYGVIEQFNPVHNSDAVKQSRRSSQLYIVQYCLVHLGDIARYRQQTSQAENYYRHAAAVVPYNGQPYNQLAILEVTTGQKLPIVFYYVRSLAVKHPFPLACTNLEKVYSKMIRDLKVGDPNAKLSAGEVMSTFLHLHALVHLCSDLDKAEILATRLTQNTHIMAASAQQLIQMLAINLFALEHAQGRLDHGKAPLDGSTPKTSSPVNGGPVAVGSVDELSKDEKKCVKLLLQLTYSMLESLLLNTPKQEQKARDCHTLPTIKLLLDWFYCNPHIVTDNACRKYHGIWQYLVRTLNTLQVEAIRQENNMKSFSKMPLPEDWELQSFLPLAVAQNDLDFKSGFEPSTSTAAVSGILRCQRIVARGLWLAEEFANFNLLCVTKLASGRLEFSTVKKVVLTATPSSSADSVTPPVSVRKPRQNVAIQALMRKNTVATPSAAGGRVDKKVTLIEPLTTHDDSVSSHESFSTPRSAPVRSLWEPAQTQGQGDLRAAAQPREDKEPLYFLGQPMSAQEVAQMNPRFVPPDSDALKRFLQMGAGSNNNNMGGSRAQAPPLSYSPWGNNRQLNGKIVEEPLDRAFPRAPGAPPARPNGQFPDSPDLMGFPMAPRAHPARPNGQLMDKFDQMGFPPAPRAPPVQPNGHLMECGDAFGFPPPRPAGQLPFWAQVPQGPQWSAVERVQHPPVGPFHQLPAPPGGQQRNEDVIQVNSWGRSAVGQERQRHLSNSSGSSAFSTTNEQEGERGASITPASQVVGSPSLGLDREMARIYQEMRQNQAGSRKLPGNDESQLQPNNAFSNGSTPNNIALQNPYPGSYSLFNSQAPWNLALHIKQSSGPSNTNGPPSFNGGNVFKERNMTQQFTSINNGPTGPFGGPLWASSAGNGPVHRPAGMPVMPHTMQNLWNSGPSPLEQLLQQQRQKRNDPH